MVKESLQTNQDLKQKLRRKDFLNNIKKVVKGSFTYAYEKDLIKTNPSIGLKLPKYDVPPNEPAHIFTNEEIIRMKKYAGELYKRVDKSTMKDSEDEKLENNK